VVTVRTTILEVKDKSLRFTHEMVHDETHAVVARTTLKAVHMDTFARKSCAFAQEIVANARALVAGA
jgi:acyl-CoA thioester hydrolase